MNRIYKRYRERLIEISGRNRSLFLKSIIKKYSWDLGAVLEATGDTDDITAFLWHRKQSYTVMSEKIAKKVAKCVPTDGMEPVNAEKYLQTKIADLKYLKRESEELEKETGRYELFVGYPFVFGQISNDISVKAPLLLFPVSIDTEKETAILSFIQDQPISINKNFVLAYSKEHNIKTDNLVQEFDPQSDEAFGSVTETIEYLTQNGFRMKYQKRKGLLAFDETKEVTPDLEIKNMMVLGRFPTANSIYNDYLALEKNNLTSDSINLLLQGIEESPKKVKKRKFGRRKEQPADTATYTIQDLDYSQENALEELNKKDNLVIYGPPGTGKSQTIVNIISDALCKDMRVLVVSQKRAALDVVYSRLNKLNAKAMLIPDPEKDKLAFFDKAKQMHTQTLNIDTSENLSKYNLNESNINKEIDTLASIGEMLFKKREFGLSLQEMYAASYNIGKDTKDYEFYKALTETNIINRNYAQISEDIKLINDKNIPKLYLGKIHLVKKNQMVTHIKTDLDMHKLKETRSFLAELLENNPSPFDASKYPFSRYVTTFYLENNAADKKSLRNVARIITEVEYPTLSRWLRASHFPLLWGLYPFLQYSFHKKMEDINVDINITANALDDYASKYALLSSALDSEGYALAVGALVNGNLDLIRQLLDAFDNYVTIRDMNKALNTLTPDVAEIIEFAYNHCEKDLYSMKKAIDNVLPTRIYHEIIKNDDEIENVLSKTVTFDALRERILNLKAEQREISKMLAMDRFSLEYAKYFTSQPGAKDYFYQIQKQRALWPIRRMVEYFSEYLFRLFPCWLLSPQAVSTIMPLEKNMFDLVVFDEASQIFVEAALPAIFRGKKIIVAGDNRQLRPTSTFMRRYMGQDVFDPKSDLSTQAALEVESLLDLATAKFPAVNLCYHYRSASAELIDFSNNAFYENKLQIAPNVIKSPEHPPIERIKVKGNWKNRCNHEEAVAVVKLVKTIFKERQFNESIGIVTFNIEQKEYIEDLLDAEADKSQIFRKQYSFEQNRFEDGENTSIFVKNLENVQGDERDIVIFSIGYAKNDFDKVIAQFGSLSTEGGENRLNVAITRAKKKIYIVTSIDPEELDKAETTKNSGPRLLKRYLQYARAVSDRSNDEVKKILSSFDSHPKETNEIGAYENQIKEGLEAMGYKVDANLGNTDYKLSLGVYDEELGRYVLGIECDYEAYKTSKSVLERDVFRIKFLESRGWKVVRVWSRDWWQNRNQLLQKLALQIETEREKLKKQAM